MGLLPGTLLPTPDLFPGLLEAASSPTSRPQDLKRPVGLSFQLLKSRERSHTGCPQIIRWVCHFLSAPSPNPGMAPALLWALQAMLSRAQPCLLPLSGSPTCLLGAEAAWRSVLGETRIWPPPRAPTSSPGCVRGSGVSRSQGRGEMEAARGALQPRRRGPSPAPHQHRQGGDLDRLRFLCGGGGGRRPVSRCLGNKSCGPKHGGTPLGS